MKEYIVIEWYDDIGVLQQRRTGELVRCQNCIYYRGHNEYCECDHYAKFNGYCHYGNDEEMSNDMGSR